MLNTRAIETNTFRKGAPPLGRTIKRSIICAHPLEWDAEQYLDGEALKGGVIANYGLTSDESRAHFKQMARAVDIWNRSEGTGLYGKRIEGLKGGAALTENNFWFAHPVYFLNHLDSAGLSDASFNPYANRAIARQWSTGGRTLRARSVVVKDNPGFAPVFWQHSPPFEGDTFRANGQPYAVPTGLFNQEYHSVNRRPHIYHHVGVDFRGRGADLNDENRQDNDNRQVVLENGIPRNATPIKSFIHGKVINFGLVPSPSNLGRILIIANTRGEGIYLLAHLSGIAPGIIRPSYIEPGETVAYVGGSGIRNGRNVEDATTSHLHVEYFNIPYDPNDDSEDVDNKYVHKMGTHGTENILELRSLLTGGGERRRNPFDHSEFQE
jgi:hypothetical protein